MKTTFKLTLAAFLAAGVLSSSAFAQNSPVVMRIIAGSTGLFVPTSHSLTTSGYTDFAANIKVREDGSATGQFVCAAPGAVVIAGQAVSAVTNSDGSVTINGVGYGYFIGVGGFENDSFFVTFRAGGPRVGGFDFADATFPAGFYDTEVVKLGSVTIDQ
ncbi:MAG TPA: hypothetical protein VGF73_09600 [Chthoniobacterales bacterium]|jgi:hypothetical protein